ncbi:hypothetical protein, partial [Mycolicibacter kumamotonensis]
MSFDGTGRRRYRARLRRVGRLRRLLEERIGKRATDTALGLASTTANALALAPSMLAVDLAINTLKAAETRAVARAWSRREPALADMAAQ